MPRLFLGNFEFEHRLADPQFDPPARLKRLNAELASAWLSIAGDGDFVWAPEPWNDEFLTDCAKLGLPKVVPVASFCDVPVAVECVPWGWSSEVRRLAQQFGWSSTAPSEAAVRTANSRRLSEELERTWGVGLQHARRIERVDELELAIRSLPDGDRRWVLKAEFGMSARERILGNGPPKTADLNWIRRRLGANSALFFEPWVERIAEVGIQIEIPRHGSPYLVGVTPMLVDTRGQYAGSWVTGREISSSDYAKLWSFAIETAIRAAEQLQQFRYFGPLGIDAMVYRDLDGTLKVRPLQDINARWSMGRLSLGWKRFLNPSAAAVWQHGSVGNLELLPISDFPVTRIVETSPKSAGANPCQHVSRLLICEDAGRAGT